MLLSDIGEFRLINNLKNLCKRRDRNIISGIGDDAAAVNPGSKKILLTSDMLLEGVHFDLSFTSFSQLGYKTLAVNLSDIFAMGGKPLYFLLNLGIPETCSAENIMELYRGLKEIAGKFEIGIIGGDTCASKKGLVLSGTLIGETGRVVSRAGARPGDSIFVTGSLGDSAMGLELLKKMQDLKIGKEKYTSSNALRLCRRHLMPEPEHLKRTAGVTSMIDISDGLLIDLSHICDESRVGALIYKENIPISEELGNVSKKLRKDPFDYALKGGEDYRLLFTSPSKSRKNAVRIGEITKRGRYIVDSEGRKERFRTEGYEHFRE